MSQDPSNPFTNLEEWVKKVRPSGGKPSTFLHHIDCLADELKNSISKTPNAKDDTKTVDNMRHMYDKIDEIRSTLDERVRLFINRKLTNEKHIPQGTNINYCDAYTVHKGFPTEKSRTTQFYWTQDGKTRTKTFGLGIRPSRN